MRVNPVRKAATVLIGEGFRAAGKRTLAEPYVGQKVLLSLFIDRGPKELSPDGSIGLRMGAA